MKAFRFRLHAVLTLREQAEQAAQQRCAQAYTVVEAAATRVRHVEAEIDAAEQAHRAQLASGPRAGDLEQLQAYSTLLHERRRRLARELADARRRADEAWRELLLATQQREALEHLRGRQQRVHDYQTARTEQQTLDELVGRGPTLSGAWTTPALE
jgi:flagellar export protein FliJ